MENSIKISVVNTRNRNGSGSGRVFHTRTQPTGLPWKPGPDPWVCPRNPNPVCLLNGFFSQPQTRPIGPPQALSPHAQPSPKSKTQILIYDFSTQNHKHRHKSKHDHKHKLKNHKHKYQIYDFPFQNHKPNTNFRSMIFPFKITNTNSHDWEFETNWTHKK